MSSLLKKLNTVRIPEQVKILKSHGILPGNLAEHVGLSYGYISGIMTGCRPLPKCVEAKFDQLISDIEAEKTARAGR